MIDVLNSSIKSLLGSALTDSYYFKKLMNENIKEEYFGDYKDFYCAMIKSYSNNNMVFEADLFFMEIANTKMMDQSFDIVESSKNYGFDTIISTFKQELFKRIMNDNLEQARLLTSTGNKNDLKKAYNLVRQEIVIHKEAVSSGTSIEDMVNTHDYSKVKTYSIGLNSLKNVKIAHTDLVVVGARPSIG